jgi:hypothetical protein
MSDKGKHCEHEGCKEFWEITFPDDGGRYCFQHAQEKQSEMEREGQ